MTKTSGTRDGIVIVGGGFAGFWAAAAARRVGGAARPITLVAPTPVLVMRPRLYEANPESLGVHLFPLLDVLDVEFVPDAAVGLDTGEHEVTLASGVVRTYGRLVVAVGSAMRRPPIEGVETTYSIDTQAEAVAFDARLAQLAPTSHGLVVAVVGAGFTGIELVLELRDRLAAHGADTDATDRLRIVLIDRADVVGPELGAGPRPAIVAALADARVELRLGTSVQAFASNGVVFADGSVLDADAVVLATGLAAAPFVEAVPGQRDHLGRIMVDPYLRAPAAPDVFVTGDAASADTGNGRRALQSCQHALQLGRYAGENAARDMSGLPTIPYEQLRYVTCLDLGRAGAVFTNGWDRNVAMTGSEAKAMKRRINTEIIYPPAGASLDELLRASELPLRPTPAP